MTFPLHFSSVSGGDDGTWPRRHRVRDGHSVGRTPDHGDHAVVARLRAHDEAILTELFDRYFDGLTVFITRIVQRSDVAAELAGDVFMRLWDRRTEVDFTSSVAAYLFTAGRHLALNYVRNERSRDRLLAMYGEDDRPPGMGEPPSEAEIVGGEHRRIDDVMQAIVALPPVQRQATLLRWHEDMSYPDVAAVMGISPNAVKLHISRALKTLRARLAGAE